MTETSTVHIYKVKDCLGRLLQALLAVFMTAGSNCLYAQTDGVQEEEASSSVSVLDTIPEDARAVFNRYVQQEDTATNRTLAKYRKDKFSKRLSFHTNMVDWATLVPNIGIEFDLSGKTRTQYSLYLHGKYNGSGNMGRTVYNVNALRLEGRKYWRTGKYGKTKEYYESFVKLCTDTADKAYFNADTLAESYFYVDEIGYKAEEMGVKMRSMRENDSMTQEEKDSLDFREDSLAVKQRRFRRWVYNTYHKFRRNVTSGRTLSNPRNWRAYYLGVWVGLDDWSISMTGKGKQGNGIGVGILGGYTIPLFPQKYPREGSLDLDLGLAIGWKAVKYDAYNFEDVTRHYVYDPVASQKSFKVVPYPVIQDLHVSLVWRFRGIKNKVDLSLVDAFDEVIAAYEEKSNAHSNRMMEIKARREELERLMAEHAQMKRESDSFWDAFDRKRFEIALKLNPDTVFTGEDQQRYLRIVKGIAVKDQEKYLHQQEIDKAKDTEAAEKLARKKERELKDSLEVAQRDSLDNAGKSAKKASKAKKKKQKNVEKEDTPQVSEASPVPSDKSDQPGQPDQPNRSDQSDQSDRSAPEPKQQPVTIHRE